MRPRPGTFRLGEGRAAALLCAVVAVLPLAVSFSPYALSVVSAALLTAVVAVAWNLLADGCGQVSFGHAGFFGIGAYASALLAMKAGLPPLAAMPAAGAVGAAAGLLVGMPVLRLRGAYFAMAMLIFAEAAKLLCRNAAPLVAGSAELYGVPGLPAVRLLGATVDFHASRTAAYGLASALLLIAGGCAFALRGSPAGLKMAAVAEDEDAAASVGIPVFRTKATALCASAFLSSLAGAFYAHHLRFLSPDTAFDGAWSLSPIVASLIGGMRSPVGPAAGALLLAGLDEFLFKRFFEAGHKLFFGLLLAALIVWLPSGLLGRAIRERRPRAG